MLQIYNTLSKKKEPFKPIVPGQVSIYVCGLTVYDYSHIGHARAMIAFDVIVRFFRYLGYKVTYVRNITDVDDKIIKRANENGENHRDLTERFIKIMHEDAESLNLISPDYEPRATDNIETIITMIQAIIDNGHAYVADNGDVYFDVRSFTGYGKLSRRDLDQLRVGARIDVSTAKRDPLDFVLWKAAKAGEPSWDSAWGKGRPGWHIECSAMSTDCLNNKIDIHGGGMDLVFPHHENEIAQAEAATNKNFANYWIHIGLLQINSEKMSKSLGNFFALREVLTEYNPEIIRYFMLASHYRSPLNYSMDNLKNAKVALERFYVAVRDLPVMEPITDGDHERRFVEAMSDDFNTPEALAILFEMTREINRLKSGNNLNEAARVAATQKKLAAVLGLLQQNPKNFLQSDLDKSKQERIEMLISERSVARENRDWQIADRIRSELLDMGIEIEDTPEGTVWRHS